MKNRETFDEWWDGKFGFQKLSNPLYPFLKQIHALGGDPEYILKLTVLFSHIDKAVREAKRSPKKRVRGGIHPEMYLHICEPALKEFGWEVFIEMLRNTEDIYRLWRTPTRTVPSREFLDVMKIGGQIMKKCMERIFSESAERVKETRKKSEQEIADGFKARPFGDIIYEYAWTDLIADRGKPSKLWETFCLTALSEHLRESTPGKKPHFSLGAWFLNGKLSRNPRRDTKRIGERVRQFKKAYPNQTQQVEQLKRGLQTAKGLVLP